MVSDYTYLSAEKNIPAMKSVNQLENSKAADFSHTNIRDLDLELMFGEGKISKQCTVLDLKGNKITHLGAAMLASFLKQNSVSDVSSVPFGTWMKCLEKLKK